MKQGWMAIGAAFVLAACSGEEVVAPAGEGVILYAAATIITMDDMQGEAKMVAVADDRVLAVGGADELSAAYPAANLDETFAEKTLVPGLIDPHIHWGCLLCNTRPS